MTIGIGCNERSCSRRYENKIFVPENPIGMSSSAQGPDPYLQFLPELHRELAAPEIGNRLPLSLTGLDFKESCAWWETLRYLLRSLLGWRCLPAGLAWWYEGGKDPGNDPLLQLVRNRWDTRGELDHFAAREWETGGVTGVGDDDVKWPPLDYEPSPGWRKEYLNRCVELEYSPQGGGYNPLHLGHSDFLGENSRVGSFAGSHTLATRHATLVVSTFSSWQHELRNFGASLPRLQDDRSWTIEVFDRKVGFLGGYRQSRMSDRWFQGKHSIHMAGNPPIS
jgi:hypothetical protein